ncbi:MAG: GguC protein [Hyphomicrobiales bacterium]|nr:GguC protein [Hyphomicrobiales bacterium]
MLISQIRDGNGTLRVVARNGGAAHAVAGAASVYDLAKSAIRSGRSLSEAVAAAGQGEAVDMAMAASENRFAVPITLPDAAHLKVTGTGLTHLGSAAARDAMHAKAADGENDGGLTDSMKIFNMGVTGGRPAPGEIGVQPEWFYKGNGNILAEPGGELKNPAFAEDGGEEPEIAGIYVIDDDGVPVRIGFALANEFSDHVTERVNYLYLAHSKLRMASIGPEILVGDLPKDIQGTSRIFRNGSKIWEKPFLSGEQNMSHSIANLEHHHFKYELFRQPGDVHVHMFGTATLSYSEGVRTEDGDVWEIEAPGLGLPLRNTHRWDRSGKDDLVKVRAL